MSKVSIEHNGNIMVVSIEKDAITVECSTMLGIEDLLEALNAPTEAEYWEQVKNVMPHDYDFILVQEQYQWLLGMGSPQIMESGWNFAYQVSDEGAKLSITGYC